MIKLIIKKEVGKKIKEIRKTSPKLTFHTMEELASKVGSNKSNVSRWERGINLPNPETLEKIARLGGMTVNELLHGSVRNYVSNVLSDNFDFSKEPYILNHATNMVLMALRSSDYPSESQIINTYEQIKNDSGISRQESAYKIAYNSDRVRTFLNKVIDLGKNEKNLTTEQRENLNSAQTENQLLQTHYNRYFNMSIQSAINELESLSTENKKQ